MDIQVPDPEVGTGRVLCDDLTDREIEVLTLIGQGYRNKEIARLLVISEKTVKNHISNIFSKLHVCDRAQAALYAIRRGLVGALLKPFFHANASLSFD